MMIPFFWSGHAHLERSVGCKEDQLIVPVIRRLRLKQSRFIRLQQWSTLPIIGPINARILKCLRNRINYVLDIIGWRVRKLLTLSDTSQWRLLTDDVIGAGCLLRFYDDFPEITLILLKRLVRLRTDRSTDWLFSLWDPWGYLKWTASHWARETRRFLQNYDGALEWQTLRRADFVQLIFWLDRPFGMVDVPRRNRACKICQQEFADQRQVSCPQTRCGYGFHTTCLAAAIVEAINRGRIPRCPVCKAIWIKSRTWNLVRGGFRPPIPSDYLLALKKSISGSFR